MDEIFYYLYLWWEISCIFYNTRLNTHMMEKCQIIRTPINTIRHITINCEQFSWNVNCCLRQRKTSYNMICGHVNTKECLKRRKLNIVVSSGEVAQINNESTFAQYGSYSSFANMFGLNLWNTIQRILSSKYIIKTIFSEYKYDQYQIITIVIFKLFQFIL